MASWTVIHPCRLFLQRQFLFCNPQVYCKPSNAALQVRLLGTPLTSVAFQIRVQGMCNLLRYSPVDLPRSEANTNRAMDVEILQKLQYCSIENPLVNNQSNYTLCSDSIYGTNGCSDSTDSRDVMDSRYHCDQDQRRDRATDCSQPARPIVTIWVKGM